AASPQPDRRAGGSRVLIEPVSGDPIGLDDITARVRHTRAGHVRDAIKGLIMADLVGIGVIAGDGLHSWSLGRGLRMWQDFDKGCGAQVDGDEIVAPYSRVRFGDVPGSFPAHCSIGDGSGSIHVAYPQQSCTHLRLWL